jgi:hypothetical protein
MSTAAALDNRTPFVAEHFVLPDGSGNEIVLVVLKATFTFGRRGEPIVAAQQTPIRYVDGYHRVPGGSSPRFDSDLVPTKPRVDVLVEAQAWAPGGRAVQQLSVGMRIGSFSKVLQITGDRVWRGSQPSAPESFVVMPIVWERAYGGQGDNGDVEVRNLVGVGHHNAGSSDPTVATRVPNIEYPRDPMQRAGQRCTPAGLGPVARNWQPRAGRAGTYDDAWKARRWPLLPQDFNPAFNQAAPDDQQLDSLVGGEDVVLVNLTPEGTWQVRLPALDIPVRLFFQDRVEEPALRTDTLEILPEHNEIRLTSRVAIPVIRNRGRLLEILLGHVKPGYLRARTIRKIYADFRGEGGTDPRRPCYHP